MSTRSTIFACAVALLSILGPVQAHTVITYPGWRGNNLHSNGTTVQTGGLQPWTSDNGTELWPYGMQWTYPCGGMPVSQNRTKWPVKGGALAFQPGWFAGHSSAYIYINLGFGNYPQNYSSVMYSGLQIVGPTKEPYPGTFCIPQIPLPANTTVKVGDNATIQLIETAIHGGALYNCVDITFAEPEDVELVTLDNCFNSSQITHNLIFTTTSLTAGAEAVMVTRWSWVVAVVMVFFAYMFV